ncbi:MAG: WYL domain-containing protein [Treponema succinifaciens]|nr:MAG: WYL domain-containing protein [Treponema succinifaciens]
MIFLHGIRREKNINGIFNKLKNAIIEKQQVEFDYFSLNKKTEHRTVQPWKIVFRGVGWYFFTVGAMCVVLQDISSLIESAI